MSFSFKNKQTTVNSSSVVAAELNQGGDSEGLFKSCR